jgi:hypothetical protein
MSMRSHGGSPRVALWLARPSSTADGLRMPTRPMPSWCLAFPGGGAPAGGEGMTGKMEVSEPTTTRGRSMGTGPRLSHGEFRPRLARQEIGGARGWIGHRSVRH